MSIIDHVSEKRYSRPALACNCICKTTPMQEREAGEWVRWTDHVDAIEAIRLELVAVKKELTARGTLGRVLSGMVTGVEGAKPYPLKVSLQIFVEEHDMQFVSFHRRGAHGARIAVKANGAYHFVDGEAEVDLSDRAHIDNAIYDSMVSKLTDLSNNIDASTSPGVP